MRFSHLALAFAALSLVACGEPKPNKVFSAKVHAYLMEHPEVLREAMEKLREKETAQANAKISEAIRAHRAAIERDPRDFVANPGGKVTVTEFYDYRCPHCINVTPAVLEMIRTRPDIRFVFKEMPIFGAPSERAAKAALLTKVKGGDYLAIHREMMDAHPLEAERVDAILKSHGLSVADMAAFESQGDRQLADIRNLAALIGIDGTPAFIIGDILVPGENLPAVEAAITKAKGG